jgi:small subunit ribosomal protein S6
MATTYDILFIIKPDLTKEKIQENCEKMKTWITKNGGEIVTYNEIGMRDLAQELTKFTRGYYVNVEFNGDNKLVETINQNIRVTEDIFRHLIVLKDSIDMKGFVLKEVSR